MKCGARVALGVAGGYFLGRTRKMKLALMLGGMAAGRRAGGAGSLVGQATKLLTDSPEVARLGTELRGRLLEAARSAAIAVATRQVEALTDRLSQGVGSLSEQATPQEPDSTDGPEPNGDEPATEEPSGTGPADQAPAAEQAGVEEPARRPPARTRAGGAASRAAATQKRTTRAAGTATRGTAGRSGRRPTRANRSSEDD